MPGKRSFEEQIAALDSLRHQPPEACIEPLQAEPAIEAIFRAMLSEESRRAWRNSSRRTRAWRAPSSPTASEAAARTSVLIRRYMVGLDSNEKSFQRSPSLSTRTGSVDSPVNFVMARSQKL